MYYYYSSFCGYFFSASIKNLFLFNKIIKIFPNTTQIICEWTGRIEEKPYWSPDIVCSNFFDGLLDILSKIEQNKTNKLKKIIIKTYKYEIKYDCNLEKKSFGLLGWKIEKENKKEISLTKQEIISNNKIK